MQVNFEALFCKVKLAVIDREGIKVTHNLAKVKNPQPNRKLVRNC